MLLRQLHQRADHAGGGVRDQQVETAELCLRLVDQRVAALGVVDAALDRVGRAAQCLDLRERLLGGITVAEVGEGDRGAALHEIERDGAADAARPARHEGEAAVEFLAHAGMLGSPQSPFEVVWPRPSSRARRSAAYARTS